MKTLTLMQIEGLGVIGIMIVWFIIVIVVFLILRELVMWYWKINEIITNQNKTNELLERLVKISDPNKISSEKKKSNYNTLIFDNLEVMQEDFSNPMKWNDAMKACRDLGDSWRLPTIDELETLLQNRDRIGNFNDWFYWSSKEGALNGAWLISFHDGSRDNYDKERICNVRAVRSI